MSRFKQRVCHEPSLTRRLVSNQANKVRLSYRWYRYKEAFSASLVEYLLGRYNVVSGRLLDPFAGSGTALIAASATGIDADGIELLPIGRQVIETKLILERKFTREDTASIQCWAESRPWNQATGSKSPLLSLRITRGAYPPETLEAIERYMETWKRENERVQFVLRFALLCILESISYTRKDGQYLRWDYRSGRKQGKRPFNKGVILDFDQAICSKLREIIEDTQPAASHSLFPSEILQSDLTLFPGSCLEIMPTIRVDTYDAILTSPPYCNRYDYTRTYALELALLGTGERELAHLRQQMLSCTVENRAKDLLAINPLWGDAIAAADGQNLLQAILQYLEDERARGSLNNNGIPRMVRGYFYEMACVIADCARTLKPNAPLFMVNDNVRYSGASISVDLILSDMAQGLGFHVESILVLPGGKGNSSQQMGEHGREPLRKCVYVWRRA
jgi:DNA modification methylase